MQSGYGLVDGGEAITQQDQSKMLYSEIIWMEKEKDREALACRISDEFY